MSHFLSLLLFLLGDQFCNAGLSRLRQFSKLPSSFAVPSYRPAAMRAVLASLSARSFPSDSDMASPVDPQQSLQLRALYNREPI